MHKYATTTPEARELVAELEFVWDQIRSNSTSSSGRGDEVGDLRLLRPVSDGDGEEANKEEEKLEVTRDGLFDGDQEENEAAAAAATVPGSLDLDSRNRKWRKNIEQALVKITTEIAALREQIEAKRIGEERRRGGLWAWMMWLVWVAVRHLIIDLTIIGILVAWARRKDDRRVERSLNLLMQYLRERTRRPRWPAMLRISAQRA